MAVRRKFLAALSVLAAAAAVPATAAAAEADLPAGLQSPADG
ncbi:hypothetical protein [Amycolatopsis sp. cmx-4-68]